MKKNTINDPHTTQQQTPPSSSEEKSVSAPTGAVRYSDQELQEFKVMILAKLEDSRQMYDQLKETLSMKTDHGTDDTSPTFKLIEDAGDMLSKEEMSQYAIRQLKFIKQLENALIRIENKTYGICRATGKLISKERLRSVPHSTLSIDAKRDATE